ncbi:MAG: glycogen/starch synthase [Muribaculaceae bacterium]|nr:glycogen/starch synthase [Muribaculaceae bacterium]
MDVKKVLYVSQEIEPYLPATPMSLFGRKLSQGMQEKGAEVRTFMPKYGAINERRNQLHEVIRLSGLNIVIDDTDHPLIIKVATLQPTRLQVYFIDNDDYFFRQGAGQLLETIEHVDTNDERTIFFVRGVVETVKKLRWEPDIVHCVGWITALIPLYLKHIYNEDPAFRSCKVVYSLFAEEHNEKLNPEMERKLLEEGFTKEQLKSLINENGEINYTALNKIAIDFADAIAISSENVDPALIEYAKNSGKPLMEYPGEEAFAETYAQFYKSL